MALYLATGTTLFTFFRDFFENLLKMVANQVRLV